MNRFFNRVLFLLLMCFCFDNQTAFSMARLAKGLLNNVLKPMGTVLNKAAHAVADGAGKLGNAVADGYERATSNEPLRREIGAIEALLAEIKEVKEKKRDYVDRNDFGKPWRNYFEWCYLEENALQAKLEELQAQLKAAEEASKGTQAALAALKVEGAKALAGRFKGADKTAVATAAVQANASKERLKMLLEPKTLMIIALVIAVLIIVYFVAKFGLAYAESMLGRPDLVRESSILGYKQIIKKFIKSIFKDEGDDAPEELLKNIVLSPQMQEAVYLLANDARQSKSLGLPYQSVLFYGPPGTGKTEFAKILAQYSGMDYAILSGADFSQFKNGEGITELHKLFAWANNSKNGLLIFIDEADACFKDRSLLEKDAVNIVNAFLSHTGCSSDKFMIVFATNYADELDAAVRSRIHKKFAFLLPALEERYKILMLKISKYIVEDKRAYYRDGEKIEGSLTIDAELNEEFWRGVATRMEGFSGRDIDQLVNEMRIRAYRSGMNVLTKDIVEFVLRDKIATIAKDKKISEYQRNKFEKMTGLVRDADEQETDAVEPVVVVKNEISAAV